MGQALKRLHFSFIAGFQKREASASLFWYTGENPAADLIRMHPVAAF